MSLAIPVKELSEEDVQRYRTALHFEYKSKDVMRYKSKHKPKPKVVNAYVEANDIVHLPMWWAWKNFRKYNTRKLELLDYKQKLYPWNELQEKELADVVKNLRQRRSVALTLRTGAGKTAVSLFAACDIKVLTVVFVHVVDHCEQWLSEVEDCTTAKAEIVETDTNGINKDTQIIICFYGRWMKIPACIRERVGLLIIDECDEFNNRTGIEAILSIQPIYTLGCTATFARPGTGLETIMHAVLGHAFVTREFDVHFEVRKILTGIEGEEVAAKHTRGICWNKLKHSLLYNDERNMMILQVVKILLAEKRKIIMICTEIDHTKLLHKLLMDNGTDNDYMCDGKNTYEDKLGRILIGTAKSCGRGFDQKNSCKSWCGERIDCVFDVDYCNNDSDRTQRAGRAFRANNPDKPPIIVHLVDENRTIVNQWRNAEAMYKRMGAEVQEYTLST